MNWRDTAERLLWTAVAAFGSTATAAGTIGISVLQAGLLAAWTAVWTFLLLLARTRLAVLPDPGQM